MSDPPEKDNSLSWIVSVAILGSVAVGFGGLIGAFLSSAEPSDPTASGIFLLASAIAFGSLANALLRS